MLLAAISSAFGDFFFGIHSRFGVPKMMAATAP
jgi:hypothetical protein